jgi:hypothetical protein
MPNPAIVTETLETLTNKINDGISDITAMVRVVLGDEHWSMASEEQAVTFLMQLMTRLLKQSEH